MATVRGERGFTLVEAVVAIMILGVVVVGVLPAFSVQLSANTRNEIRSGAIGATQIALEALRRADPLDLPTSGSDAPVTHAVGSRQYEVVTHYCLRTEFCSGESRHLFVEVFLDGRKVYDVETVYVRLL